MEIHHKPRPWQGWREFLKEYGIIVLGVLTALAAEQVVEGLHHRAQAAEARAAIRQELAGNLGQMVMRSQSDGCVKTRLAEIQELIAQWSPGRPVPLPLWLGRPTTWELKFSSYQAANSDGRVALLPAAEQADYASVYAHIRTYLEAQERERPAWARLQALEASPPYNPILQSEILLSLQEAKYDRARAASATRQALRDVRRLHIQPNTVGPQKVMGATAPACIPLHTARAAALDLFYGKGDRSADP